MTHIALHITAPSRQTQRRLSTAGFVAAVGVVVLVLFSVTGVARAAEPAVGLGTATPYSVLAGSAVTNTGSSSLSGDLGVSPGTNSGTEITGFPPGLVLGATHNSDAVALQAQVDLVIAYNDAAGRTSTASAGTDVGGSTFVAGVYTASSSLGLTGTVTLDAQGDPNASFIFQVGSTLITAPDSTVSLINGANACNVFWQVGSSATLDSNTTFVGTIMALTSITLVTGATVEGRALARNGAVTLDTNTFTEPGCDDDTGTSSDSTTSDTATDTATVGPTDTDTVTATSTDITDTATSDTTTSETTTSQTATETSTSTDTGTETTGTATETTDTPTSETATETTTETTTSETTVVTTPSTTPADATPFDGPPLAYTGTSSATLPTLYIGLGLLMLGTAAVLLARPRLRKRDH